MAAHALLKTEGLDVESYGVGNTVKLPGASPASPNRYPFGTPYSHILADLTAKNKSLYSDNGLLTMMDRNQGVKIAPQRWQDRSAESTPLDIVISFESKVFDIVVQDLRRREVSGISSGCHPCLVINLEVRDSTLDAAQAAPHALLLCKLLEESEDWETEVESVLDSFVEQTKRKRPEYDVCFS
ncbi:hypothetical protein Ndes2526B_g04878 [Nannochloris sp. 'desiccata']